MMKRLFWTAVAAAALPSGALGDVTDKEVAACAAIEGDLARLECFDGLARRKQLAGPRPLPAAGGDTGKWRVAATSNPIDDSKTVTMRLEADSGAGKFGTKVQLFVRCKSNETALFIVWNDYLGSEAYVLTRVGGDYATRDPWNLSTDKQATFHPKPIPFIKRMLDADKLVAEITPYNESPTTAIFNTQGMGNAIKPVRETCHW